jgi:hypothetical protein
VLEWRNKFNKPANSSSGDEMKKYSKNKINLVTEIEQVKNQQREKRVAAGVSRLNVIMLTAEQMEKVLGETTCFYLNTHQF